MVKRYEYQVHLKENVSKQMQKLRKSTGSSRKAMNDLKRSSKDTSQTMRREMSSLQGPMQKVKQLAMGIGAGLGAAQIGRMVDQVGQVRNEVNQLTDATDKQRNRITKNVVAIGDVYKKNYSKVLDSANTLTKQMGGTAEQNLKLIEKMFKRSSGGGADLLEQVKEFAPQFKKAGLEAENMVTMILKAQRQGVWDDKALDTVKEMSLSLTELASAQKEALRGIGMSPGDMKKRLNQNITTPFQEMQRVIQQMNKEGVQDRQQVVSNIFRGPGENLGDQFLNQLGRMSLKLDDVKDKTEGYIKAKRELTKMYSNAKTTLANKLVPALANFFKWMKDNKEVVIANIKALGSLIAGYVSFRISVMAANAAMQTWNIRQNINRIRMVASAKGINSATVAMRSFNRATKANIIGAIAGLLTSAVTAYLSFADRVDKAAKAQKRFNNAQKEGKDILASFSDLQSRVDIIGAKTNQQVKSISKDVGRQLQRFKNVKANIQGAKEEGVRSQAEIKEDLKQAKARKEDLQSGGSVKYGGRNSDNEEKLKKARQRIRQLNEESKKRAQLTDTNLSLSEVNKRIEELKESKSQVSKEAKERDLKLKTLQDGDEEPNKQKGLDSVTGSGKKHTNITINLDKFQEELNINTESMEEGVDQLEERLKQAFLRILNSGNYAFNQQ